MSEDTIALDDGPRVAYVNARLIDPATGLDQAGMLITAGSRIAEVLTDAPARLFPDLPPERADSVVDCGGLCLAPGFVDMRARLGEPGAAHKETIETACAAAAAGGITALACPPDTEPPIDSVEAVEFIARRAREVKGVKVHAQACITRGGRGAELAELGLLREAGAVAFTDGAQAVADALVMLRALSYASAFGLLLIQHPAEPRLTAGGAMNAGEIATRLGLSGIPRQAEVMMIERDLRLVEMTGARYHVAHVSTAEAVAAVRAAKARGLPVTCDTAPPYFCLTEVDVAAYRTFAKLSPPLRTVGDVQAVIDGVADGTIDAIASDHDPQDQDSKRQPFAAAEPGMVGLETLFPLAMELVHKGALSLADLVSRLSTAPARLLGLPGGRLTAGAPADLVLFDPDAPGRIDVAGFRSKSKNSLFDRRPVLGRIMRTVVDGRTVFHA